MCMTATPYYLRREAYEGQGSVAVNVADGNSHTFNFSWDMTRNNRRCMFK